MAEVLNGIATSSAPQMTAALQKNDTGRGGLAVAELSVVCGQALIVDSVGFHVPRGGTLVLVGESGCGKTTLLRAIAGLRQPQRGSVLLDGCELSGLPPGQRRILYLDQEPLLFEHLSVLANASFALRMQGLSASAANAASLQVLADVGMACHADKWPHQLSGGQKQRTAFARAVLARPEVLLLDEPFSALDAASRTAMQQLFLKLAADFRLTSILVTHDIREALAAGSTFCRMERGRLRQYTDRREFIADAANGVLEELAFWREQCLERLAGGDVSAADSRPFCD